MTEVQPPSDKYIFFDIKPRLETGIHEANLIVAEYMCGKQQSFLPIHDFCQWLIHKS